MVDMEAMFGLTTIDPSVCDAKGATQLDISGGGAVSFRNVTFGYGPDRRILGEATVSDRLLCGWYRTFPAALTWSPCRWRFIRRACW